MRDESITKTTDKIVLREILKATLMDVINWLNMAERQTLKMSQDSGFTDLVGNVF